MKFARYWTRGRAEARSRAGRLLTVTSWGWSMLSLAEAEERADAAARRGAARIAAGEPFPHGYEYTDRPAREEMVEEFRDEDGELSAAVTRNSYGSLILNTRDLMFIDVDLPPGPSGGGGLLDAIKGLFGQAPEDPATRLRQRIEALASAHPQYTFRVYRTFAGFRCAVVNRRLRPDGAEAARLLEDFGADPLYVRLCRSQQSFRARLTPKYWRCGADRPPPRFPWEAADEEAAYRAWERAYEARCAGFAACRLVGQFGPEAAYAEARTLIELHDRRTGADSGLTLA